MNRDERLASLVERNVNLETEKQARAEDIRELHSEVKGAGYDLPAFRLVVKRAMEAADKKAKRETAEEIAASMMAALGMLGDLPLGRAAVERAEK
jgi:uncharacterized protein (UPF0335 family)